MLRAGRYLSPGLHRIFAFQLPAFRETEYGRRESSVDWSALVTTLVRSLGLLDRGATTDTINALIPYHAKYPFALAGLK